MNLIKMNIGRCPLVPKEDQKRKTAVFHLKSHFVWRKSATKFLYVKTASDKVLRHLLAYLYPCENDWWGMSSSTWKFGGYWPTILQNADFQSIFARIASAVTHSKKDQLTRIGNPLRAFDEPLWIAYVDHKPSKGL